MSPKKDSDTGTEQSPEVASEALSPDQERAQIALEVLEGRKLGSPAARKIDDIDIRGEIMGQIEGLQNLFLGSMLLITTLIKMGKLKKAFSLDSLANISVPFEDISEEQFSALKKLREIASNKDTVISKFWNSEIMSHLRDSVKDLSVTTDAAVDVITGKPARDDVPQGDKSLYEKTQDFIHEHPRIAGAVAVAGAFGIGYGLFKLIKKAKQKLGSSGSAESQTQRVVLEESTGDKIWKWAKRGALVLGGTWIAGRILGLEAVQKWLDEKGIKVDENRFLKSLVLFSDFKIMEGLETLKRGIRTAEEERRHETWKTEFGLGNSMSIWLCADENCKELLDLESHDHSIGTPGALASIPFLGNLFTNEQQLEDERKLRQGLIGKRDKIERISGWESMTIDEVLKQLIILGVPGAPGGDWAQRELDPEEHRVITEQEEELVTVPVGEFEGVMGNIDQSETISREEKKQILELIGDREKEGSILNDLSIIEKAIPDMWDTWKSMFKDVTIGAGGLSRDDRVGERMCDMFGLDLEDREEMDDLVRARHMIADNLPTDMERGEIELTRGLILEVEGFRDFIEGLQSGEKLKPGDLEKFRNYKTRFTGPSGIFKQIKLARQRANNEAFAAERAKFGEWTVGDEGQAVLDLYLYSLYGYTMEAFISADASTFDKGVGLTLTTGTVAGTVALPLALRYPHRVVPVAYHALGFSKGKFLELQMFNITRKLRAGNLTRHEAEKALTLLREIRQANRTKGIFSSMSQRQIDDIHRIAADLLDDISAATKADDFGHAAEIARVRSALQVGGKHADAIVKQYAKYKGIDDDAARALLDGADDAVDEFITARKAYQAAGNQLDEIADISVAAVAAHGFNQSTGYVSSVVRGGIEGARQSVQLNKNLVRLLSDNGVNVSGSVAAQIGRKYPKLMDLANGFDGLTDPAEQFARQTAMTAELDDIIDATKGVDNVADFAKKAEFAFKAQQALLVIGIVVDIFAIGMSLYRIKDLQEIIDNATNPAIKEIYQNKQVREYLNIGLSGTSIVISASALVLTNSAAAAGAVAGAVSAATSTTITAASLTSASTGVGLVLIPIVIAVGGYCHVMDVMDEGKIEIAREKEDWKQLPTADLYRQWITMVGTNDSEALMAFFTPKNIATYTVGNLPFCWAGPFAPILSTRVFGASDRFAEDMEKFKQEKVVTREEIVRALIEKELNVFDDGGDNDMVGYAVQYARASLGENFDTTDIQNAKAVIGKSVRYAKMMATRDHMVARRGFLQSEIAKYLPAGHTISPDQIRLTQGQIDALSPEGKRSYDMLIGATSHADLLRDYELFDVNSSLLPESNEIVLSDVSGLEAVLGDFDYKSKSYLEAKLSSPQNRAIFESLKNIDDNVLLNKLNEIRTVEHMMGMRTTNVAILLPVMELYAGYRGLSQAFEISYPSSPQALDKWCFDLISGHTESVDNLSASRSLRVRSDEEIMAEYGVAENKFLYAIYRLAVDIYGYKGGADEESLKRLYAQGNANVFGIYWDGARWVVQEAGMESDDELADTDNPDKLLSDLLSALEAHGDDMFEETGESSFAVLAWALSPGMATEEDEFDTKGATIAERYREVLSGASEEYASKKMELQRSFEGDVTKYIQENVTDGSYVVLPGYLIAQGLMAGYKNLGLFSYSFEGGKVVCHQLYEGQDLEAPIGAKGSEFESYELISNASEYGDRMKRSLTEVHNVLHIGDNEFDIPREVDLILTQKRSEVDTFMAGLSSFPTEEQEALCRQKVEEIDEFNRIMLLTVLTEAASGSAWAFRFSDDVDRSTIDESVRSNLAMHQSFNYSGALREHWKKLSDVSASVESSVRGEKYAREYLAYFNQAMSLALAKSITLYRDNTGQMKVQSWKSMDVVQMQKNTKSVLLYNEWVKEYKDEDVGETSSDFRFEFEENVVSALAT